MNVEALVAKLARGEFRALLRRVGEGAVRLFAVGPKVAPDLRLVLFRLVGLFVTVWAILVT